MKKAESFLSTIPFDMKKIAIHIRRGDYGTVYSVYGKSAMLPLDYYKEQIKWFEENINNPFFIFLSDDTTFVENEFKEMKNKIISTKNSYGVDLAIITRCSNAILSPSTFSWWGAYLMDNKEVIFTPKYWTGFNSKIENHKNSNLSFAIEVDINQ